MIYKKYASYKKYLKFVMIKWIKKCVDVLSYHIKRILLSKKKFPGSKVYWEARYSKGGNSGAGSYNILADFKAEIINNFVDRKKIQTVIEFGCGDGNQLSLAKYPQYTGFDVSETAIKMCKHRFKNDNTKTFLLYDDYSIRHNAELTLSLDVIYHLVEDVVFEEHMNRLFQTSFKYVIIYSCDFDSDHNYHIKPRQFTKYIQENINGWDLLEHIPNKYPDSSIADFYIYSKNN